MSDNEREYDRDYERDYERRYDREYDGEQQGAGPAPGTGYPGEYGQQYGEYGGQFGSGFTGELGGEYDEGATAFVNLPEGLRDGTYPGREPLAAPGNGYTPPPIATPDQQQWAQDVNDLRDAREGDPHATGQWNIPEQNRGGPAQGHAPGQAADLTGQWTIPVADGDLPDESGEFTTSALAAEWNGSLPPTLPGGAPAPWATGPAQGTGAADTGAQDHWPAPASGTPAAGTPAAGNQFSGDPGNQPSGSRASDSWPATLPGGAQAPWAVPADVAEEYATRDPREPQQPAEPARGHGAADGRDAGGAGGAETAGVTQNDGAARDGAPGAGQRDTDARAQQGPADGEAGAQEPQEPHHAHAQDPQDPQQPQDSRDRAEAPAEEAAPAGRDSAVPSDEHPLASYVLRVNGADRPVADAWIGESLLYVLRERLGLAGAKDGCSQGECGACAVQVDGRLVASCLVPAATAAGSEVRTVEGLAENGSPSDVQRALARCGAVQCGFCIPGMAMTVHDLLEGNHAPTELEARQALAGNLCRCSGYRGVLEAVREVVAEREALAAEADEAAEAAEAAAEPHEAARIPHQAPPGAGGVHPAHPDYQHPHYPQDGGMA
ncbi:2Fe-2S iron-sulfur cluster-binding protein [Streptomyces sp. GC420]|uniref:2Fe-2S iron-sulfur cluster-binding protein n=1 Tax=Streptomyces sp. GC420 TaxID=2697568 RepID=UPI001414F11D|nr:2Fe-2S iron-sulfur cluster-binding protein [Streptomyces sp. GC420]NBM17670.1 (2Fe-2S)-binding protein [Streptomyces sp. GC420]